MTTRTLLQVLMLRRMRSTRTPSRTKLHSGLLKTDFRPSGVLITTNKLASLALSTNETGAWSATSALTATSSTQKGKERRATDQRRARKIRMTVPRQEPARAQALILSKVKMGNLHHTNFPFEFLHLHSGQMHTLNGSLQCSGALLCHSLLTCSNFNDVALAPVSLFHQPLCF